MEHPQFAKNGLISFETRIIPGITPAIVCPMTSTRTSLREGFALVMSTPVIRHPICSAVVSRVRTTLLLSFFYFIYIFFFLVPTFLHFWLLMMPNERRPASHTTKTKTMVAPPSPFLLYSRTKKKKKKKKCNTNRLSVKVAWGKKAHHSHLLMRLVFSSRFWNQRRAVRAAGSRGSSPAALGAKLFLALLSPCLSFSYPLFFFFSRCLSLLPSPQRVPPPSFTVLRLLRPLAWIFNFLLLLLPSRLRLLPALVLLISRSFVFLSFVFARLPLLFFNPLLYLAHTLFSSLSCSLSFLVFLVIF